MNKVLLAALLLLCPSTAMACDLDGLAGFGGMHRFDPFTGMRSMPEPSPTQPVAQVKQTDNKEEPKPRSKATTSSDPVPDEPRKWEVEGGSPVTAENKATFT